jgi:8-oxo-dGTP pyrophosphatase MutT (NUDIX family)
VERRQFFSAGRNSVTLAERLRAAISAENGAEMILHDGHAADIAGYETKPAAVLIAVTDSTQPRVILTARPETMRSHAGQVAFPGGRIDRSDADVIAAALREAEEEIGLPRDIPTVIGTVDLYRTLTLYAITPVLAVIPDGLTLVANPDEVSDIFEVPLDFLMNPANHQLKAVNWKGRDRHIFEMYWDGHRIWGATAAMIVNLSRRLAWQR